MNKLIEWKKNLYSSLRYEKFPAIISKYITYLFLILILMYCLYGFTEIFIINIIKAFLCLIIAFFIKNISCLSNGKCDILKAIAENSKYINIEYSPLYEVLMNENFSEKQIDNAILYYHKNNFLDVLQKGEECPSVARYFIDIGECKYNLKDCGIGVHIENFKDKDRHLYIRMRTKFYIFYYLYKISTSNIEYYLNKFWFYFNNVIHKIKCQKNDCKYNKNLICNQRVLCNINNSTKCTGYKKQI